ncbi:hypothetical protein EYR41_000420 [Orbilia oligospora]|uniref:Conserved oligomeric Golgi complex subunit 1 n=1 Tax=Orbilia oligospora TaxID=2813651 RepID=A0A7C8PFJ2_ORBOL|nr:hypothetical protein TWF751_009034 [Orbilia oligospora]TGJ73311.1 hypothetical protein EYR41_000420 [Orbilia oligospora]
MAVDGLKLEKWEDAFQHPVASVRGTEKQLRVALQEKKEGLRALVGESYRDLLKTAERIIEMNDSIQRVEFHLSQASKQCNYGTLQKKAANAITMKENEDNKDRKNRVTAAELAVLSNCPVAISRTLSRDKAPLIAAKLYILARLLRRSVSEKIKSPFITSLERQLSNLRVTILRDLEHELCKLDADSSKILQCLGAYSLITSSSASDTFMYFQNLRLNAVVSLLRQDTVSAETILEAIRLVNENLRLSTQLFPRRLSDTLTTLKIKPIFQEPAIHDILELNMAVHGSWISESIRKYTPWLKTDDLSNDGCKAEISSKLGTTLRAIFDGLEKAVKVVNQVESLVQIRYNILAASRGVMGRTSDLNSEDLNQSLNKIREIVNTRIREVLNGDIGGIGVLGSELSTLVANSTTRKREPASWSSMLSSFENAKGGRNLKAMVKAVNHSDKSGLRAIRLRHAKWVSNIANNYSHIKKMAEEKDWDPDNDDDDDEIDAPESLKEMNNKDTESLLSTYSEGLLEGYRLLETNLSTLVDGMRETDEEAESTLPIENSCIALRFITVIRNTSLQYANTTIIDLSWFGKDATSRLYEFLAKGVAKKALRGFGKDISRRKWTSDVSFDSLWEGSPKLPVQPSPLVFKFLRALVQSMNDIGADVWSRDAADTLKRNVAKSIWEELEASLVSAEKQTNGVSDLRIDTKETKNDESKDEGEDAKGDKEADTSPPINPLKREQVLQTYFDTTYLDNAFRTARRRDVGGDEKNKESTIVLSWEFVERTREKISIETDERERMSRSAEDYWRRTSLIFGALDI